MIRPFLPHGRLQEAIAMLAVDNRVVRVKDIARKLI
jgi:hypothetical protein